MTTDVDVETSEGQVTQLTIIVEEQSYNYEGCYAMVLFIGVFHAMAGMAAAMPGLKFPSAGIEIEANR